MKCPNPECPNNALEETYAFCFQCGHSLRGEKQTASSPTNSQPEDTDVATDKSDVLNDKPQPSCGELSSRLQT